MSDDQNTQNEMLTIGGGITAAQRDLLDRDSFEGGVAEYGKKIKPSRTLADVNAERQKDGLMPLSATPPVNPFDIKPEADPSKFLLPKVSGETGALLRDALVAAKFPQDTSFLTQVEKNEMLLKSMPKDQRAVWAQQQRSQLVNNWGGEDKYKTNMKTLEGFLNKTIGKKSEGALGLLLENDSVWAAPTVNYLLHHVQQLQRQYNIDFVKSSDDELKQKGF